MVSTLLKDIGYSQENSTTIFDDNQSCMKLIRNPEFHSRTKHIDIQHHFVREHVEKGKIKLVYCQTEEMVADILTKALAKVKA